MPVRLVHPHVERGVVAVGEAALGLVELERGDAEVEQDAERGALGVLRRARWRCRRRRRGRRRSGRRSGPAAPPARTRASSSRSRPMTRAPRAALEDRLGVAAHPEGAVDAHRAGRPAAPARGGRRCGRAAPGRAAAAASPRLLIVVLRVGAVVRCWAGPAAGRPGGWSPSDPGPARGKSRRESGRLEAGSRVVGRGVGSVASASGAGRRGAGGQGRHSPGTTSSRVDGVGGVGGHDLGEVGVPGGGVPDLEPVAVADDRALLVEVRVGAQRRPGW